MICNRCLGHMKYEEMKWYHNEKLCNVCHHNAQPISRRIRDVERLPPTFRNLKKLFEKDF
jgi:hypothetical protein|tara:strand:+ start:2261 stop:2440 length:180 start_codon:yes stop_codon:yes gene_type:complete